MAGKQKWFPSRRPGGKATFPLCGLKPIGLSCFGRDRASSKPFGDFKWTQNQMDIEEVWMRLERFEEDPSIENYVALRRFAPGCDTEIYRLAGVDPLLALGEDWREAQLDRWLVCNALVGDDREMDELCLQLMERLIERKRLEAKGETHLQSRGKGISDALVNHLIVAMMEVLGAEGLEARPSLVLLVREQFGGANTEIYKSHTKRLGRDRAIFLGMQMRRGGEQPTIREIARKMGVQPSTVSRWFPNNDFPKQVENFEKSFVRIGSDNSNG
jgi:hypothetical protein